MEGSDKVNPRTDRGVVVPRQRIEKGRRESISERRSPAVAALSWGAESETKLDISQPVSSIGFASDMSVFLTLKEKSIILSRKYLFILNDFYSIAFKLYQQFSIYFCRQKSPGENSTKRTTTQSRKR